MGAPVGFPFESCTYRHGFVLGGFRKHSAQSTCIKNKAHWVQWHLFNYLLPSECAQNCSLIAQFLTIAWERTAQSRTAWMPESAAVARWLPGAVAATQGCQSALMQLTSADATAQHWHNVTLRIAPTVANICSALNSTTHAPALWGTLRLHLKDSRDWKFEICLSIPQDADQYCIRIQGWDLHASLSLWEGQRHIFNSTYCPSLAISYPALIVSTPADTAAPISNLRSDFVVHTVCVLKASSIS